MQIVIIGMGEVGKHLASLLSDEEPHIGIHVVEAIQPHREWSYGPVLNLVDQRVTEFSSCGTHDFLNSSNLPGRHLLLELPLVVG